MSLRNTAQTISLDINCTIPDTRKELVLDGDQVPKPEILDLVYQQLEVSNVA